MAPDVCVTKTGAALVFLCLATLGAGSPVPPRVLQSDTNVALLPHGSLPANFSVLSVALLPDAAAANVTLLPLAPPQLVALPAGAQSVAEQLPLEPPQPPDLPPAAAGSAYVLSHVIIEVGVLDDDNSTANSTDDPEGFEFTGEDVEDGKKSEAIKEVAADDEKVDKKEDNSKEIGKNGGVEKSATDKENSGAQNGSSEADKSKHKSEERTGADGQASDGSRVKDDEVKGQGKGTTR